MGKEVQNGTGDEMSVSPQSCIPDDTAHHESEHNPDESSELSRKEQTFPNPIQRQQLQEKKQDDISKDGGQERFCLNHFLKLNLRNLMTSNITGQIKEITVAVAEDVDMYNITKTCRICYGTDSEEEFISPCRCRGSLKYVHASCLETWLNRRHPEISTGNTLSLSMSCENCECNFETKWRYTFSLHKSLYTWFSEVTSPWYFLSHVFGLLLHIYMIVVSQRADSYLNDILDIFEDFGFSRHCTLASIVKFSYYALLACSVLRSGIGIYKDVRAWFKWWRSHISLEVHINKSLPER